METCEVYVRLFPFFLTQITPKSLNNSFTAKFNQITRSTKISTPLNHRVAIPSIQHQSSNIHPKTYHLKPTTLHSNKPLPPLWFFFVGVGMVIVAVSFAVAGVFGFDTVEDESHVFDAILFLEARCKIDHFPFGKV